MKKNILLLALCTMVNIWASERERGFLTVPWQYTAAQKQMQELMATFKKNSEKITLNIVVLQQNTHLSPATIAESQRSAGVQSHRLLEELNASLRELTKQQEKILNDLESRAKTSDKKRRMSNSGVPATQYDTPWKTYST